MLLIPPGTERLRNPLDTTRWLAQLGVERSRPGLKPPFSAASQIIQSLLYQDFVFPTNYVIRSTCVYCVLHFAPGILLVAEDTAMNKTDKYLCLPGLYILVGETASQEYK